jgi:hypothetical protein
MTGDEGVRFFATVDRGGQRVSCERDDRIEFLFWLDAHCAPDDDVTITIEATGPAARRTIASLRFGALQLAQRNRDRDGGDDV